MTIWVAAVALTATAVTSCGVLSKTGSSKAKTEVSTPAAPDGKSSPELTRTTTSALAGEWQIIKVGDEKVDVVDDMPYVNFDVATNAFYASNGCNLINGAFKVDGSKIELTNVLATMKMCADMKQADAISGVLSDGHSYTVAYQKRDGVDYLNLNDRPGHAVMKLRRCDMNFLNGEWQIAKIGDRSYDNPEMNVFFDIPAGKVHGNTGCNYFNGEIYHDPTVPYSVNFGQMATTRMACPDNSAETSFLVALEQVTAGKLADNNPDVARLTDAQGNVLLTLKRIQIEKQ